MLSCIGTLVCVPLLFSYFFTQRRSYLGARQYPAKSSKKTAQRYHPFLEAVQAISTIYNFVWAKLEARIV